MTGNQNAPSETDYHEWRTDVVNLAGIRYRVATKPGVLAHRHRDTAALLLAKYVAIAPGAVVVHMNCGNGLLGVVATGLADRVVLTDRNILSFDAARRTLAANDVSTVEVFLGQGSQPLQDEVRADVVAIRIPHEKLALSQLLWDGFKILKVGGHCYLAGATKEGVKSAARMLARLFGNASVLGHDSGYRVVVAAKRSDAPAHPEDLESPFLQGDAFLQVDAVLRGRRFTFFSRPGVFSWDHLDEATQILADVMQVQVGESVLDLGCGYGAIGVVAGFLSEGGPLCMVDADVEAVRSAARSAEAAGISNYRVLTSDVASAVIGERFDVVVTNPPFHVGKATELDVPLQFIHDAWAVLVPGGRLFLVANRTLPYELAIKRRFGNVANLHDGQRFKVLTARKEAY